MEGILKNKPLLANIVAGKFKSNATKAGVAYFFLNF